MCNREVRILILSAGGLTGTYLLKHFKKKQLSGYSYNLFASDLNQINPSILFSDCSFQLPKITDPHYYKELSRMTTELNINLIFPTCSHDVAFFSETDFLTKHKFLKAFEISQDQLALVHNKKRLYSFLSTVGLRAPSIYNKTNFTIPFIVKPIESSGSKGIKVVYQLDNDLIFDETKHFACEYIKGEEYTVDCLSDNRSCLIGYNVRQRILTRNGAVVVTRNNTSERIDDIIEKILLYTKIKGPFNFQYIKNCKQQRVIIDFNPRLPSGGLPLTVESGFDIPNKMVQILLEGKTDIWQKPESISDLMMLRYYEEAYSKCQK